MDGDLDGATVSVHLVKYVRLSDDACTTLKDALMETCMDSGRVNKCSLFESM